MEQLLAELRALRAEVAALAERIGEAPPELLTVDQAAKALAVCRKTVDRLVARGKLKAVRLGKRGLRVPVAEIRRFSMPAPPPKSRRRAEPYDARAEYDKAMRRLGGKG